jgi:hypothetical protein
MKFTYGCYAGVLQIPSPDIDVALTGLQFLQGPTLVHKFDDKSRNNSGGQTKKTKQQTKPIYVNIYTHKCQNKKDIFVPPEAISAETNHTGVCI